MPDIDRKHLTVGIVGSEHQHLRTAYQEEGDIERSESPAPRSGYRTAVTPVCVQVIATGGTIRYYAVDYPVWG